MNRWRLEDCRNVARQEGLEGNRRRDVHRIVCDELFERGQGFGRRRERPADVELHRPGEPVAKRLREWLLLAERGSLARFVQQMRQAMREFIGAERAAEQQRQRHEAHAGDIRAMIES